jgi:hypothetical protein
MGRPGGAIELGSASVGQKSTSLAKFAAINPTQSENPFESRSLFSSHGASGESIVTTTRVGQNAILL